MNINHDLAPRLAGGEPANVFVHFNPKQNTATYMFRALCTPCFCFHKHSRIRILGASEFLFQNRSVVVFRICKLFGCVKEKLSDFVFQKIEGVCVKFYSRTLQDIKSGQIHQTTLLQTIDTRVVWRINNAVTDGRGSLPGAHGISNLPPE